MSSILSGVRDLLGVSTQVRPTEGQPTDDTANKTIKIYRVETGTECEYDPSKFLCSIPVGGEFWRGPGEASGTYKNYCIHHAAMTISKLHFELKQDGGGNSSIAERLKSSQWTRQVAGIERLIDHTSRCFRKDCETDPDTTASRVVVQSYPGEKEKVLSMSCDDEKCVDELTTWAKSLGGSFVETEEVIGIAETVLSKNGTAEQREYPNDLKKNRIVVNSRSGLLEVVQVQSSSGSARSEEGGE